MNPQLYYYDTQMEWSWNRRSELHSRGLPDLTVSTPPEFKGEAGFWTPEHLFVAAAEACLLATFLGIAENSRLRIAGYQSSARGKLERVEGAGLRFTEISIHPIIHLERADDRELAERVLSKAAKSCLIANSMNAAIRVEPRFESVAPVAA